ncbi:MAG: Hsp20/alpha crystallin family protein [Nitrospirota bacterium]
MAEQTVPVTTETKGITTQEELRAPERYLAPAVDIFETTTGLVVVADLPGVHQEGLDLRVDDDVLTIQGRPRVESTGDERYREYTLHPFFRQFELTEAVDQRNIAAHLQHGVLTLTLPKAEKAKPRRIPVRIG